MPKRFLTYSRNEPARTILFCVGLLTGIMQTVAVVLTGDWSQLFNLVLVLAMCAWTVVAAYKDNPKQMSLSAFWLFMMWLWSAVSRIILLSSDLLWMPMLIVAVALAVVYIHLSHQRKAGKDV